MSVVLVVNSGSSSFKYQLIDMEGEKVLCKGLCERIGMESSMITHEANGEKKTYPAIFTTESRDYGHTDEDHMACWGLLTDIQVQDGGIRIGQHRLCARPRARHIFGRMTMAYWLMKSEPDVYSYDDLVRESQRRAQGMTALRRLALFGPVAGNQHHQRSQRQRQQAGQPALPGS